MLTFSFWTFKRFSLGQIQRGCSVFVAYSFWTTSWEQQLGTFLMSSKQVRFLPPSLPCSVACALFSHFPLPQPVAAVVPGVSSCPGVGWAPELFLSYSSRTALGAGFTKDSSCGWVPSQCPIALGVPDKPRSRCRALLAAAIIVHGGALCSHFLQSWLVWGMSTFGDPFSPHSSIFWGMWHRRWGRVNGREEDMLLSMEGKKGGAKGSQVWD